MLAPNGYCRPFDIDATGYTRSEAICVIFLQKAKDAKRIYSTVLYSKTNCDGKLKMKNSVKKNRFKKVLLVTMKFEIVDIVFINSKIPITYQFNLKKKCAT